jgi:hypothetical protein
MAARMIFEGLGRAGRSFVDEGRQAPLAPVNGRGIKKLLAGGHGGATILENVMLPADVLGLPKAAVRECALHLQA